MNPLNQLAQFVAQTTHADLPKTIIERAKLVLRDTIGVIIGGMLEPEVQALADHVNDKYRGRSVLLGHGGSTQPEWAAMVLGTAGTSLEMDEGHAYARGHAAIHAAAPAFALASEHKSRGQALLLSFILGYEVAARAGVATRLRSVVHPFGTWGVLGAAAVATCYQSMPKNHKGRRRYRSMTGEEIAGTLELAASYAISSSFESAFQGANVRNSYAGTVNQLGMRAPELYALGFRGQQGALQTSFGEILGESFDENALIDGLGSRYEIMRGYFKPYSGCRYTHGAIDALLQMQTEEPIDVAQIKSITVDVYDIAARLNELAPQTSLAGRFSLPHVVAATLVLGHAKPESFTVDALKKPQIRALAAKVQVAEEPSFTALTPAQRPTRVTIHLQDGTQRSVTVMSSKGDPDQPMTNVELQRKFFDLTIPALGQEKAEEGYNLLGRLEELETLKPLFQTLTYP